MNNLQNNVSVCDRPLIVGVGGFTSEVGKTTLLCNLLRMFPGWEAIKTTRGHYRSCGKDPHACCVSDLLEDKAVIRSGKEQTYAAGKDTGRYWDSGAENVHWVIATDEQLADGIRDAIGRVKTRGVFVEGNSFSEFINPDFFIMVARSHQPKIKATARKVLGRVSAFYVSDETASRGREDLQELWHKLRLEKPPASAPVFSHAEMAELSACVKELELRIFA